MIYLFHEKGGDHTVTLEGDDYKHMIKARRHEVGDTVKLRHIEKPSLYTYRIAEIEKKYATLLLEEQTPLDLSPAEKLHLGWALIDPKSVEKVLPSLCEIGVSKITFIYAKRSQQHFQVDHKRLERIILNSMQQSGRVDKMDVSNSMTLEAFVNEHPDALVLDFCESPLSAKERFQTVIIGPEGGFSDEEKRILKNIAVRRLNTPMVLRSETAALAVAAKLLL